MAVLRVGELQSVAAMREGSLAEVPFARLLAALASERATAALEIQRRQVHKEIVFEGGALVDCRSNLANETLGRFMLSLGRIDTDTFTACFAESCAAGIRFGDVVLQRGLVTAEELIRILQQNLAKKLLDGFSWREGEFRLRPDVPEVDSPLAVNVAQLVVIGITKLAPQAEVDAAIGALVGRPLALDPSPPFPLAEIRLSAAQQRLTDTLREKPQRMDQLAAASGLPFGELNRLLFALTTIGAVTLADQVSAAPAPAPKPAPAPPAAESAATGWVGIPAALRNELMQLILNYRRRDAFELLGVPTDASDELVRERYLAFAERFAPWKYDPTLAEKAKDIFLAGAAAYAQLRDREQREALVARREARSRAAPVRSAADQFRTKTTLLDPEIQFREGKALMEAGDYRKAVVQLEYACDLDPQNAVYGAELAYCRFLHSPPGGGPRALDDLGEVLRRDPRCGLATYYSGEVLRAARRFDEAEEMLKRAIKPLAPDRRPVDALHRLAEERRAGGRR